MDWTWDLTVLYRDFDDPQIEKDFQRLKDVAASAGIDVHSVDFWRQSLKVYTDEIQEFMALADELM